jgi:hypothetical protein
MDDGDHLDMEHFHFGNFKPYGEVPVGTTDIDDTREREEPRGPQWGCCEGIDSSLTVITFGNDPEEGVEEDEEGQYRVLTATVPGSQVFWSLEHFGEGEGSLLLEGWQETNTANSDCPQAVNIYYPGTVEGCGSDSELLDMVTAKDNAGCYDSIFMFGEVEPNEFNTNITTSIKSGAGCDAVYVAKGDEGSAFPIKDFESRSYCSDPGEWLPLEGTLGSPSDELSVSYSYQTNEYRGYDKCGDIVEFESPVQDCATCGGGDTVSGADNMACEQTETFSFNNTDGGDVVWSFSGNAGNGASIDEDGNLTTGANCCGTVTVTATNSCCTGSKDITMPDGYWELVSETGLGCTSCPHTPCFQTCTYTQVSNRTVTYLYCCVNAQGCLGTYSGDCDTGSPCDGPCAGLTSNIRKQERYKWSCIP